MTAAPDSEKKTLRKRMLTVRRSLSAEERESFSVSIAEKLKLHTPFSKAKSVFAYAAMEDEVQTEAVLKSLLAEGKTVSIPWITGKRTMEAVEVPSWDALQYGEYHILTVKDELRAVLSPDEIDCVLVPGVAFSRTGVRLGMGGGYYDSFLPRASKAVRIALAFHCQVTDALPSFPYDCGVDWIITEKGVIKTGLND